MIDSTTLQTKVFCFFFSKKKFFPSLSTLLAPTLALAHAHLQSAIPPAGSASPSPPSELQMNFSERLEPSFCKVQVTDAAGASANAGPVHGDPGDGQRLIVPIRTLKPGTYTVHWHAVSADTHKTQGSYRFTVTP